MGKMLIKIFDADAFAYDLIWIDFGKCFHVDYDQEILFFFYGFLKIETCFIKKIQCKPVFPIHVICVFRIKIQ